MSTSKSNGTTKHSQPFWLGGLAAAMAACFTHPLDQTKYRMQVMPAQQSMLRTMVQFVRRDGVFSLWQGISASILRQATYSTARFGLYHRFADAARRHTGQAQISSALEIVCAGAAGGCAGLVGNPTEVALVRMCADGARPPAQRFEYKHAIDALMRVGHEEGVRTFARGLSPNVVRSVLMNISQIATYVAPTPAPQLQVLTSSNSYSASKRWLLSSPSLGLRDGMPTHFLASLFAGTVATTVCAPADVLKSRLQNAVTVQGSRPSAAKIVRESFQKEGASFLLRGWTPAWLRLAPNTVLTFVFIEQLQRLVHFSGEMRSSPSGLRTQKA